MLEPLSSSVAVAVSGGVDSLYALSRLHVQGLAKLALHGRFLSPKPERDPVPGLERQCERLGLPLHVVDLREAFAERVIRPFADEYAAGATPNPCSWCNMRIKFGLLFEAACALGATHLATGHYAGLAEHSVYGRALRRGEDQTKDQSYFLALVPRGRLAKALFPLAGMRKPQIVEAVAQSGLDVPLPKESQEICFVPDDAYRPFLQQLGMSLPGVGNVELVEGRGGAQRPEHMSEHMPGRTQEEAREQAKEETQDRKMPQSAQIVGRHRGLWQYTEGQRRGLGIAWSEPLYVLGKDVERNVLLVGTHDKLAVSGCVGRDMNELVPQHLWPERLFVQMRYRQRAVPARVHTDGNAIEVCFETAQTPSAPGQILVVYDERGYVLAGARITGNI